MKDLFLFFKWNSKAYLWVLKLDFDLSFNNFGTLLLDVNVDVMEVKKM